MRSARSAAPTARAESGRSHAEFLELVEGRFSRGRGSTRLGIAVHSLEKMMASLSSGRRTTNLFADGPAKEITAFFP